MKTEPAPTDPGAAGVWKSVMLLVLKEGEQRSVSGEGCCEMDTISLRVYQSQESVFCTRDTLSEEIARRL